MDRDEYASILRFWSERIVGAVHDDGPDELLAHIREALTVPPAEGVDPIVALVTVLAAQVDPDATATQRLGWIGRAPERLRVLAGRKPRPRSNRTLKPCGTEAAFKRHLRRGEVACRACASAHTAYDREYEARKAARAAA